MNGLIKQNRKIILICLFLLFCSCGGKEGADLKGDTGSRVENSITGEVPQGLNEGSNAETAVRNERLSIDILGSDNIVVHIFDENVSKLHYDEVQNTYPNDIEIIAGDDLQFDAFSLYIYNNGQNTWNVNYQGKEEWVATEGQFNISGNTATVEIKAIGVGDALNKCNKISVLYREFDNGEPIFEKTEDLDFKTVVFAGVAHKSSIRLSFPKKDRLAITYTDSDFIDKYLKNSTRDIKFCIYDSERNMSDELELMSMELSRFSDEDGGGFISYCVKNNLVDFGGYLGKEGIDVSELGGATGCVEYDGLFKQVADYGGIEEFIRSNKYYSLRDGRGNILEGGKLEELFSEEKYAKIPDKYTNSSDEKYDFVPDSDRVRIVQFTVSEEVPIYEWNSEVYMGQTMYYLENYGEHYDVDVRVTAMWFESDLGYSYMTYKLEFPTEDDAIDWKIGYRGRLVSGAAQPVFTEEQRLLFAEGDPKGYRDGNVVYMHRDISQFSAYITAYIFDYSNHMEVFDIDLWEDVTYVRGETVEQEIHLDKYYPFNNYGIGSKSLDTTLTVYSTF